MFFQRKTQPSAGHELAVEVEKLEDRQMLAGNVEVDLSGAGDLEIFGDDASNRIEIVSDGQTVTVTGQGTDLNGGDSPLQFSRASITNYIINLGDGSDRVSVIANNDGGVGFVGPFAGTGFQIDTGDGNDRIALMANNTGMSTGFVLDQLVIRTGEGNDQILFEANNSGFVAGKGFDVGSQTQILTGEGNDRLTLNAANGDGTGLEFSNQTTFFMGDGNNRFSMTADNSSPNTIGVSVAGNFDLQSGIGNDRIEIEANNSHLTGGIVFQANSESLITTGDGNDRVRLEANNSGDSLGIAATNASSFTIATKAGNDRVELVARNASESTGFFMRTNTVVDTGSGDDRLNFTASNSESNSTGFNFGAGNLAVRTDSGRDRIDLTANNRDISDGFVLSDFSLESGEDNDRIQIRANNRDSDSGFEINGDFMVNAGAGDDSLTLNQRNLGSIVVSASSNLLFDGGAGDSDRLRANFSTAMLPIVNFES